MVVIGNPPYSLSSSNSGEWINTLIKDYKIDLNEKKLNLDDDYIKFIRFGQYYIEKNGEGILAYISNNSFIDGVTHRQMRKSLMKTFDKIYILDLHGNSKKKETAPDSSIDENVFDIQQGVSINIFIKVGKKVEGKLAEVFHRDLYGKRKDKYEFLLNNSMSTVDWTELKPDTKYHFFVPKDFSLQGEWEQGVKVTELFKVFNSGVETQKDTITIQFQKEKLFQIKQSFFDLTDKEILQKYQITESRDWKVTLEEKI